ncbi:hypothetical protein [Conservatibacter flavescens]|uniref:Prevent-host-death protein n=1 Tax=Conservatibacter flavescens TaxID=28161 RepID=A0A2M8S119_9PAST|nr:hypothetical protein [Conservatibacter flavescens]PJG84851.1 hypothetical protein CVP05_08415 [Conservatibacter flavescens]
MIVTAREFNQRTTYAQRQSQVEPVFITNRGNLEYVLLNYQEYMNLLGKKKTLLEALTCPQCDEIEVDFKRAEIVEREIDF